VPTDRWPDASGAVSVQWHDDGSVADVPAASVVLVGWC
jgi:hypothetical protein